MLRITNITPSKLRTTLVLLILSLGADWFSIPMLYGLHYHFSSVFLILALFLLGGPAAILLSLFVAWSNYFLLEMPLFNAGIVILEVVCLAGLVRMRQKSVFLCDLLFWFVAGVGTLIGWYGYSAAAYPGDIMLHILGYSVNGAGNALAAEMMLTYLPILPMSLFKEQYKPITLQQILIHLAISGLVFPFIGFMIVTGISQNHMINLRAHQIAESTSNSIKEQLNHWGPAEYRALELQDVIQLGKLSAMVDKSVYPSARLVVTDRNGNTLADSSRAAETVWDWRPGGTIYQYQDSMYLWLPAQRPFIEPSAWREAFYLYESTMEEKAGIRISVKLPVSLLLADVEGIYILDFVLILAYILLVLSTATCISRFIVHFLVRLTHETTGLPDKITAHFEISVQNSHVIEFDKLHENFRQMALKLKAMFAEAIHMNTVLKEQADLIKQSEIQFQKLAFTDALTKIPNRHYFHSHLREVLEEPGACGALLFMDLNQFKRINDTYGHEAGDALLQHAAHLLTQAAGRGTVCRLGGDEFVLILPAAGLEEIQRTAEDILVRFNEPLSYQGLVLQPNTSIGIARYPADADRPEELLNLADQAMYGAKQRGSGVEWYRDPGKEGEEEHE
ncbi:MULTISPECIES: diguanylate cyclase domain-containing protein [Paenibacillus]|uniref:diguanylate cyclase domain-containing protein n=1 Tax=Paenibacillus TaxID=44249 RepID=UPI0022B8D25E|nr:diguanylate cyclase [Paenibacillus caseinilyticus]MCZ8519572.1 diguanylate cyclase [Paenibacillus caseinilyticus]